MQSLIYFCCEIFDNENRIVLFFSERKSDNTLLMDLSKVCSGFFKDIKHLRHSLQTMSYRNRSLTRYNCLYGLILYFMTPLDNFYLRLYFVKISLELQAYSDYSDDFQ